MNRLLSPHLDSFLIIAATLSISAAAKRLHLTQPAVTKHVRALEEALGVRLLQRTPRGVRLTDAGELLSDYGRRGGALLDECQIALSDLAAGRGGKLTIGAGVTTSISTLPGWLRRYRRRWPRVDIAIRTGSSRVVAELVRAREVDCGFVTSDIERGELVARRLYDEEIVLVAGASAGFDERVTLSDVPLIMFPPHAGFRRFLERALAAAGLEAHVKMEIDSVEATKSLIEVGLGGAFLPESAVAAELKKGRLRRLRVRGLPRLRRHTTLIRREDRRPSHALQHFLELLEE